MSCTVNCSWTSHRPCQPTISYCRPLDASAARRSCGTGCALGNTICLDVDAATLRARYSSGRKITCSASSDSTTCAALLEVQQTSDSAFTSA